MAGISDDVENLRVNRNDFMHALDEVKPAFGVSEEELQAVIQNGIIHYNRNIEVCYIVADDSQCILQSEPWPLCRPYSKMESSSWSRLRQVRGRPWFLSYYMVNCYFAYTHELSLKLC